MRRDLGRDEDDDTLRLEVQEEEAGTRLDRLLATRASWRSRTWFHKRFAAGAVTLDGARARRSARVAAGQVIEVALGPDERPDRGGDLGELADFPLSVLYEDAHLAVVDKPAGMVAHPVGGYRKSTLINVLHARYRRVEDPTQDRVPTLANRLDRHTSGLILVALDDEVRPLLTELFVDHTRVRKTYLALVEGSVAAAEGSWDWPLGPDRGHHVKLRRAVDTERGQPSRTHWRVRERLAGMTLLELQLETGRKHQIRVHAAHAGHPVVADRIYGALRDPTYYEGEDESAFERSLAALPIQRHALHAWRLRLPHPITGETLDLEAPIPADLEQAIHSGRR